MLPSPTNIYGIPSAQALARPWPPPYRAESYYARWPALRAPSWRNARMKRASSRAPGAVTTLSRRVKWGAARAPAARRGSRRTAGRPAAGQAGLSRSENGRSEKHPSDSLRIQCDFLMKSFSEYMCPELHIYWTEKVGTSSALLCESPKSFQAICQAAGESRVEKKGGVWGTPSHFPYKLRRFIRELGRVVRSRLLQMRAEASTRRRR